MPLPLAERLRAAFGTVLRDSTAGGGRSAAIVEPDTAGAPDAAPNAPHSDRWAPLPGVEITTEAGACLLYEERFSLDHLHGGHTLAACLELPPLALNCLVKSAEGASVDLREAVFLDTETTGLAGGTGTAAFLVGMGYFEPSRFVIRQYFMRDFGEEPALLLALAKALAPFRYAVTFNGKSFDLPLLETRYILARQQRRCWRPELHLDLLHPARRLWRARLVSCSLGSLEVDVLHHRRESDVPSWAIPSLYAAYLQRDESGPLGRIFSHNRQDLLSLVALISELGRRLAEPLASDLGPDELLAVARLYDELGWRERACGCLEAALRLPGAPARDRLAHLLALYSRRAGRRERALELWTQLACAPSSPPASPALRLVGLTEIAKHLEHHQRDPNAALAVIEQALAVLELREARDGSAGWLCQRAELERRLARLLRKRRVGVGC